MVNRTLILKIALAFSLMEYDAYVRVPFKVFWGKMLGTVLICVCLGIYGEVKKRLR